MGGRQVPMQRKGMDDELIRLIKSIGVTAKLEDLIDLPEQVYETEYFDLTKEQEEAIENLTETDYIARWTKKSTIANGFYTGSEYEDNDQVFPCNKTERIAELCKENDKVIVFCRYNAQITYLFDQLKSLGKPIFIINGSNNDRYTTVKEAEESKEAVVLIQADTVEGYQLPSFRVAVFASLSFSYVKYVQALGRNNRIDNPQRNVYITLITKDSPDEDVWKAISNKQDFYIKMYDR